MTPTTIREYADDLESDGYSESAMIMRACADVVEAAMHEHGKRGGDGGEPECPLCVAVDVLEAIKP